MTANRLEQAIELLEESRLHLDRDFNWKESAEFEMRVIEFIKEVEEDK